MPLSKLLVAKILGIPWFVLLLPPSTPDSLPFAYLLCVCKSHSLSLSLSLSASVPASLFRFKASTQTQYYFILI
jgi:hypothetical protein